MAKPNYAFEKRKKELDKKRKQEEKRLSKLQRKRDAGDAIPHDPGAAPSQKM